MSRGISHSVLGITSSCNLLETLTGSSASTLYPEVNTLFSSQSFILVYFATWDEIKICQQSKCRSLNSWLSAKLIIINSCLWVCQGRMLRIQTISPIPGRTSPSPRPQCSPPPQPLPSTHFAFPRIFSFFPFPNMSEGWHPSALVWSLCVLYLPSEIA